jgi:ornithine cyclodeaminase/alanine dehydrogenase-like protein (mu-crystallin family)
MSMISRLMPLCFGRVGAHVAEALLRRHGVARPDLLAVDDETVVGLVGAGRQAGEVRACIGLAHADAPDRVATNCRRYELALLLAAELQQARGDDRVAGEVE